jgi:hypothetical protein
VREYTLPILEEQLHRNGWATRYSKHHGGAVLVVASRNSPNLSSLSKDSNVFTNP